MSWRWELFPIRFPMSRGTFSRKSLSLVERRDKPPSLQLQDEAARALFLYSWPLNVRELEKAIETAIVLAGNNQISRDHLPEAVRNAQTTPRMPSMNAAPGEAERKAQLEALLREHGGNISSVARAMGKARMQIQRWLARYGIDPRQFRR